MRTPQIIYLILVIVALIIEAGRDGEKKKGAYSFWKTTIAIILQILLLGWGGFFS
jgi:hypothetical protein